MKLSCEGHRLVNDATSTPDEPEARVSTDDEARGPSPRPHPASAGSTNGAQAAENGTASPEAAPGGVAPPSGQAPGESPAVNPADEDTVSGLDLGPLAAAAAANSAQPTPPEGRPAVRGVSDTGGFRPRTAGEAAANAAALSSAGSSRVTFGKPGAEEPATAQIRLPQAANGSANTGGSVAHRGTVPASIPQPGPAAATPPPWNRVPGQEAAPVLVENRPIDDGLLEDSEGPTAFLRAPTPAPGDDDRTTTSSTATPMRTGGRARPPRQASLQLKRLDPWSVLKLALVLAVVLFFIWLVAVGVLYGVLDGIGVWDRLNGTYADLVSGEAPSGSPLISAGRVFGIAAVVGAINSLLFAVAVTVGAFVYNVSADLVGGIEVTLSERD
jgi:hypothetical protein